MNSIRIVIDTNIFLVSLAPQFRLHWIYQYLIDGKFELCLTTDILNEYQEIISIRYGLSKTDSILDYLLLLPNVIKITPHFKWNLLRDEDDDKFVDCAIAGNADFIVSNDKDFQLLKKIDFPSLVVLTAEEFEAQFKEKLS